MVLLGPVLLWGSLQQNSYHLTHFSVHEFVRRVWPMVQPICPDIVISENAKAAVPAGKYLVIANHANSTFTLAKPSEAGSKFLQAVPLFDVGVRTVELVIKFQDLDEQTTFGSSVRVGNLYSNTVADDRTGVEIKTIPRVNADGTVTVDLRLKLRNGVALRSLFRCQPGASYFMWNGESTVALREEAIADAMRKTAMGFQGAYPFKLVITPTIVEDSKPKD